MIHTLLVCSRTSLEYATGDIINQRLGRADTLNPWNAASTAAGWIRQEVLDTRLLALCVSYVLLTRR